MIAQDPLIRTGRAGLAGQPSYVVGLDLGKIRDYSAVAVLECRDWVSFDRDPVSQEFLREREVTLRYVKRVPLQTPYPDVVTEAQRVAAYCGQLGPTTLVVDATGGGEPVVDLARWRGGGPSSGRMKFSMIPVTITGGDSQQLRRLDGSFGCPASASAVRYAWVSACVTTSPWTSVRRKYRPWNLKVSFRWSTPRQRRIVAWRSWICTGSRTTL